MFKRQNTILLILKALLFALQGAARNLEIAAETNNRRVDKNTAKIEALQQHSIELDRESVMAVGLARTIRRNIEPMFAVSGEGRDKESSHFG